jgi:hypothetical protein
MKTEQSGPPGPRNGDSRGGQSPTITQQLDDESATGDFTRSSRQVSFREVHDYINCQRRRFAALELSAPPLGTPAWAALPDDHPTKLSAVFNLAEAAAYSINATQVAEAEASKAISASADWRAIARAVRQRADFYAEKPYLRRVIV